MAIAEFLFVLTELPAEPVALAPDGPNVNRSRKWLSDGRKILVQHDQNAAVTSEPVTLLDVADVSPAAIAVVAALDADVAPLPGGAQIHHIGATALPSGHTKGDVDVNVRVDEAGFAAVVDILSARFAVAQPENWTPTFASFSAGGYALPLGIQVTAIGSPDDFLLTLRDRMRADPELLRRYDELKVVSAAGGAQAYWEAKDRFLQALRQA